MTTQNIRVNFDNQREMLVKHQFIGDVLRSLWVGKARDFNIINSEIDCDGYDVAIRSEKKTRYIQLKSSLSGGKTAKQKINGSLSDLAGGCIVWIVLDPSTMTPSNYLWFGKGADEKLDLDSRQKAKHSKGDRHGTKAERPHIREVPKGAFDKAATIDELLPLLFGSGR